MTEYPPSLLDDSAVPIPEDVGVGFRSHKDAKSALLWWIICIKSSPESRRRWAENLLGNARKAILYTSTYSQPWCTLLKDHRRGIIWLEYKEKSVS
jgi:hypothetical protein